MNRKLFGTLPSGEEVYLYTLKNEDARLDIITRGAAICEFTVFGKSIVGGFDTLDAYLYDTSHQGAVIGRVANRIANARFEMDGKVYELPKNNNGHCLHGGDGFDHKVWRVEAVGEDFITLSYVSADGEEGFPGELSVSVTYKLAGTSVLIDYTATPKAKTPISLTNHAYFNLNGFGGDVRSHKIKIYANRYTAVDDDLIPNGQRPNVEGTVFDLRELKAMGAECSESFIGYDHNFILDEEKNVNLFGKALRPAARVEADSLAMDVYTDQVGVQFYMGNFLGKKPLCFRGDIKAIKHGAFCLETQSEPNCINHGVGIYNVGEVYTHSVVYSVSKL